MRLSQFLSMAGICSRRQASRLIDLAAVTVNGEVAGPLTFVTGKETIIADGQRAMLPRQFDYMLYNKPVGVNCVLNPNDPNSLLNQVKLPTRLFPVGRLDKDSHGLLLLTNHGELCHRLLSPDYAHAKRYLVTVTPFYGVAELAGQLADDFVQQMMAGIEIKGEVTKPCQVDMLATNRFSITLTQGRNRQIRRMAHALGYRVIDLQRVSIVNLKLADLALGQCRAMQPDELSMLLQGLKL